LANAATRLFTPRLQRSNFRESAQLRFQSLRVTLCPFQPRERRRERRLRDLQLRLLARLGRHRPGEIEFGIARLFLRRGNARRIAGGVAFRLGYPRLEVSHFLR
jgi:hypothetical protein